MQWVDLVTPFLAVLATFLGLGLVVQSIRHSRALRRLEDRLAADGNAASELPLQRLRELQERVTTGAGTRRGVMDRPWLVAVAGVVALLVAAGAVWALLLRGDGASASQNGKTTSTGTPGNTTSTGTGTSTTAQAPDPTLCAKNIRLLPDNSVVGVAVFNASGMEGKAREKVAPKLSIKGYNVAKIDNPPDGRNDLAITRVQFVGQADRTAACNVARDIGLRPIRVTPLEGFTSDQIGGEEVKVVVLVGVDLASR